MTIPWFANKSAYDQLNRVNVNVLISKYHVMTNDEEFNTHGCSKMFRIMV